MLVSFVVQKLLSFMWSHFLLLILIPITLLFTMIPEYLTVHQILPYICKFDSSPMTFSSIRFRSYADVLDSFGLGFCVQFLPPKSQGSLWKREQKDCKSQRGWMATRKVSFGHTRAVAHMNSERLWQHAQDLHKLKPDNMLAWSGTDRNGVPLLDEVTDSW